MASREFGEAEPVVEELPSFDHARAVFPGFRAPRLLPDGAHLRAIRRRYATPAPEYSSITLDYGVPGGFLAILQQPSGADQLRSQPGVRRELSDGRTVFVRDLQVGLQVVDWSDQESHFTLSSNVLSVDELVRIAEAMEVA